MTKQNPLTNEQILEHVFELADEAGMTPDEYVHKLNSDYEQVRLKDREGLPESVIAELETARSLKKEARNSRIRAEKDEGIRKEVENFKQSFPEVRPEEIPESVWEQVANGASLVHAYAYHLIRNNRDSEYASKVNEENSSRSTSKTGDGETEPFFTKEQVEAMGPKEVAKNYNHILRSISKCHI